jgi:nucleoside-diphosphate-sugar epimerase
MKVLVTGGSGFIGTNFIDWLLERGLECLSLDVNSPMKMAHQLLWRQCDIMDLRLCLELFRGFQPTHVVHLAGRTDTESDLLGDYAVNFEGTETILECVRSVRDIQRVIITSSQFVFAPPGLPETDEHFNPIGAYGRSKALAEKATRTAGLDCTWTIIRPTNIWGPWHPRYPREFWLVLKKGWYIHPGGAPVMRSYGYVKNVVSQMMKILEAPREAVDGKVYYIGDPPISLYDWANGFSLAITGKPVRVAPRSLLKALAFAGSMLKVVGVKFPITLSRFRSMTENYFSPMDATIAQFGAPAYTLEAGIRETVDWLKGYWTDAFRDGQ